MECPYCGNENPDRFTEPVALCRGMPEGIPVPQIQQCKRCDATLAPAGFTPGSPAFRRAQSMRQSAAPSIAAVA